MTKSPTSGVDESLRGTYLGACQELSAAGDATAFDYIRQLGVNVVQLQPISDRYKQYDEEVVWPTIEIYDVQNHSAQKQFSTDPSPNLNHEELKTMIGGLSWSRDFCSHRSWFTIIPTQLSMVLSKIQFGLLLPDGADERFQNGTDNGNETAVSMYRSTWLIPSRTGRGLDLNVRAGWWAFR